MSSVVAIVLLWAGFAGTHLVLSSIPVRQRIIARIGESSFRGLYSLVAFAFFIPLVSIYFAHKHAGPVLWAAPIGAAAVRWVVYAGMGLAFVLLVASFVQPSPASVVPGDPTPKRRLTDHAPSAADGARAVFGLVRMLPNGHAADVAYFRGVDSWCSRSSARGTRTNASSRPSPEYRAFYERTPFIPFTGTQTLRGLTRAPARRGDGRAPDGDHGPVFSRHALRRLSRGRGARLFTSNATHTSGAGEGAKTASARTPRRSGVGSCGAVRSRDAPEPGPDMVPWPERASRPYRRRRRPRSHRRSR